MFGQALRSSILGAFFLGGWSVSASVSGVAVLAVMTALVRRSLTGVVCVADGVLSFSVPCFTVLAVASCGAAAGFYFADLLRVVTGLLTVDEVGLSWASLEV